MKINAVALDTRRRGFTIESGERRFFYAFTACSPAPEHGHDIRRVFVDPELGGEAFTYELENGRQGSVHLDAVREVNHEPEYMADLLLYKLSLAARQALEGSGRKIRDVSRALGTSPAQLYRLIDQTNYQKSFRQLVTLLEYLGCDVELHVVPSGQVAY